MPKRSYEHREPTHECSHIRPLLKDAAQIKYELIGPVILWASTSRSAAKTGRLRSSIYYQANLFDQVGMTNLLSPEPPPKVEKLDKRTFPLLTDRTQGQR